MKRRVLAENDEKSGFRLKIASKIKDKEAYPPKEDSILLQKYVKIFTKGIVLDIGTGTGIQAITAALKSNVKRVIATDIDKDALIIAKFNSELNKVFEKIIFVRSNLFERIPKIKYDTIVFNPPYLPEEGKEDYKTRIWTVGGEEGNEIILRFLEEARKYLYKNGIILLVFSSLSNPKKILSFAEEIGYFYKLLDKQRFFFEEIYVYLFSRSHDHHLSAQETFITEGWHSYIYLTDRNTIIKKFKENLRLNYEKEKCFLLKLKDFDFTPKIIDFDDKEMKIEMEYIKGKTLKEIIKEGKLTVDLIKDILEICYTLDKLKINKGEMNRPLEHIIVSNRIVFIDWERAKEIRKPSNVTDFLQFLNKIKIIDIRKMRDVIRKYKKSYERKYFLEIIRSLEDHHSSASPEIIIK